MTANADDIVNEIHLLRLDVGELVAVLRAQAEANEPTLYCPPSEHCPGGFPLRRSFVKGNENRDKLYHSLPQSDWYVMETETGTTNVHNHNVWRSRAMREPVTEHDALYDEPEREQAPPRRESNNDAGELVLEHVGALLTWALVRFQMPRADVLALLGVDKPSDIKDIGAAQAEIERAHEALAPA